MRPSDNEVGLAEMDGSNPFASLRSWLNVEAVCVLLAPTCQKIDSRPT